MLDFFLNFVGWYGAFFIATLLPALILFYKRARKNGLRNTWLNVKGPTLAFGVLVAPAIIALIFGSIETIFEVHIPSLVIGLVALFNGGVFWLWVKKEAVDARPELNVEAMTGSTEEEIIECTKCRKRNRILYPLSETYRCRSCKAVLLKVAKGVQILPPIRGNFLDVIENGDSPANEQIAAAAQEFRKVVAATIAKCEAVRIVKQKGQPMDQQALHLALGILKLSEHAAQRIEDVFRESVVKDRSKRRQVETDLLSLGHHLLDRDIYEVYGAERRALLMDSLMKKLWGIMTFEVAAAKAQEIGKGLITLVNAAQEEFSKSQKIYPEEDMPFGGTLLWEFTKSITVKYWGDYRDRTTLHVYGEALAYSLGVRELLNN